SSRSRAARPRAAWPAAWSREAPRDGRAPARAGALASGAAALAIDVALATFDSTVSGDRRSQDPSRDRLAARRRPRDRHHPLRDGARGPAQDAVRPARDPQEQDRTPGARGRQGGSPPRRRGGPLAVAFAAGAQGAPGPRR